MAEISKSRGQNFAYAELKQLCCSWMHISQDPIVGAGQRNLTFWDRVAAQYNEHRPRGTQERGARSLESKWGEVKHDVAKFSGAFTNVVDLRLSGSNQEDTLQKAKELYSKKHPKGKEFAFIECWYLLKDCPRFSNTVDDMASKGKGKQKGKKATQKENELPSPQTPEEVNKQPTNVDTGYTEDGSNSVNHRPLGNKAAKKLKAEECAFRVAAYAQRDMAASNAKRLKIMEDQNFQSLFSLRAADVDEECREFFKLQRSRELEKFKRRLVMEEEEVSISTRRPDCPPSTCNSVENNPGARIDQESLTADTDISHANAAEE